MNSFITIEKKQLLCLLDRARECIEMRRKQVLERYEKQKSWSWLKRFRSGIPSWQLYTIPVDGKYFYYEWCCDFIEKIKKATNIAETIHLSIKDYDRLTHFITME